MTRLWERRSWGAGGITPVTGIVTRRPHVETFLQFTRWRDPILLHPSTGGFTSRACQPRWSVALDRTGVRRAQAGWPPPAIGRIADRGIEASVDPKTHKSPDECLGATACARNSGRRDTHSTRRPIPYRGGGVGTSR
jgi:hypothetical protein